MLVDLKLGRTVNVGWNWGKLRVVGGRALIHYVSVREIMVGIKRVFLLVKV